MAKERVQFDFSEEMLQRLDEIVKKTGAATRVEAMRNALRAYDWLVDFSPEDSIKVTRKSDKDEEKDEEIVSALKAKVFR
jgi:metal-responsive CopG/Arc/MetJ family transcriptional regulator